MQDLSNIDFKEGTILTVDKPLTWSSFDVVKKIRQYMKEAKVGHGGTLDPLATGLLLIGTGKCTRMLEELAALPKEYTGVLFLGAHRPSLDKETEIDQEWDISHITEENIRAAAAGLEGIIQQTPPIYSAIKVDGKRSYKSARKGRHVEMKSREQEVFAFEITAINLPYISFRIHCSKGTYIRSLVDDFGKNLGVGAYLDSLVRTQIGNYRLEDAWSLEALAAELKTISRQKKDENIQEP